MIAADTSTLAAYLAGEGGRDVEVLDEVLAGHRVGLPPVVVTELLSGARSAARLEALIAALPLLEPSDGYWARAGVTRRRLLAHGHRAPLADALICQSCLDHGVALLTRDRDFRTFARHCGLRLA